ncbi:MAG: hypothetical protein HQK65_20735 [Desulfamplus sp.]|nr:hypothetical protein [Desulfamplus sp.]
MSNTHIDLIRYLFVLEVNTSLVWLPKWPAMDLSVLLGETIADRLPIVEARAWKKAMSAWRLACTDAQQRNGRSQISRKSCRSRIIHPGPWPIDAVIFWYPAKRSYGKGERILFELKLLGSAADHALFIEVILPAMEQISVTPPYGGQQYTNSLWGHFDIRSVYSANGHSWKPLVKNGALDLRRKINSTQWYSDLKFQACSYSSRNNITWLSPFLIRGFAGVVAEDDNNSGKKKSLCEPQLSLILESVAARICSILLGRHATVEDFFNSLDHDERLSWKLAMDESFKTRISISNIRKSSDLVYELATGSQTFARPVPDVLIPYLQLGSILHIGEYTHFGCGTYFVA